MPTSRRRNGPLCDPTALPEAPSSDRGQMDLWRAAGVCGALPRIVAPPQGMNACGRCSADCGTGRRRMEEYRESASERERTADILRLLPKNRSSVLEIGSRDGHFSRLLPQHFSEVTALDLKKPEFQIDSVVTVAGDVTKLAFPSNSFDCVLCTEVLEHVADVRAAALEIARVAKHEAIVGVPFEQDIRVGRMTCRNCGKVSPRWGHLTSFSERKLLQLFPGMKPAARSFIHTDGERTNAISAFLLDLAGNPWGQYGPDESCVHCGAALLARPDRTPWGRLCSFLAVRVVDRLQPNPLPHPKWIHLVLSK